MARSTAADEELDDIESMDELDRLLAEELELEKEERTQLDALLAKKATGANALVDTSLSEFTEFSIKLPVQGDIKQFSFKGRPYLRSMYDSPWPNILLKCSRQVEKSTQIGNKALCLTTLIPGFQFLYVSPSTLQAKVFSRDRIIAPIEMSSVLQSNFDMKHQSVFELRGKNHSVIRMRYAYLSADRCLHGDSRVQMADGTLRTIRDLAEEGSKYQVISARDDSSPFVATATDVRLSGKKRMVRVVTDYPVDLVCSYDHPLKTGRGWIEAESLLPSDFVAAPHILELHQATSLGRDWAWLIGAMLSEGECSKKTSVRFTNSDESFLNEFIERANRVGITVGSKVEDRREGYKTCWSVGLYSDSRGSGLN